MLPIPLLCLEAITKGVRPRLRNPKSHHPSNNDRQTNCVNNNTEAQSIEEVHQEVRYDFYS